MAFGRFPPRRFFAALAALAAAMLCAPAFAQERVPVEGMPAAFNDELRRLLREEPAPSSLFEARRQADRTAQVVARLLESEGYYAAEVQPYAEGVDTFTRGVKVTTGPLFIYASRKIEFTGPAPDDVTLKELESLLREIEPGVPAQAQPVINTGDALVARMKQMGYPDAGQQPVDALADARENTVDLTFRLQPGLRYGFGELKISGAGRTKPAFIDNLRPWRPGERYSTRKMDEFRTRLAETGLFDSATAQLSPPPDTPGAAPPNPQTRDVIVELDERRRHTIALGGSVSTSDGAGLDAEWERRNLTGMGDTLKVTGQVATLQRRVTTTYRRPNVGHYGRNVEFGAKAEDFETDAFDQTGGSVSARIEDILTPRVKGSLGAEAGFASIADSITRARGLNAGRREIWITSLSATAEYTGVRDVLDPQNGVRARLAVEPGVTFGDTNIGFTKVTGEASLYGRIGGGDRLIGAVRGRLGAIAGPDGVPPDRLFYAGGGGSVRGYEYQSLSPRDPVTNLPSGGRSLVELSGELRWRQSDRLGYVAFVDAGAAGSNVEPPIDEMRLGAGFGVRYYAGFGPLRADIAIPLDKRQGDADFQIYISIGQAF